MKGLVANLITIKDVSNATALEVVAGGRLYHVVVDTEVSQRSRLNTSNEVLVIVWNFCTFYIL